MPSSYDDDLPATREELRQTFRLVRLQIISPLSLLVSAGANIVCASLLKPNLCQSLPFFSCLPPPLPLFVVPLAVRPPKARLRLQNIELEPPVDCPGCPPAEISRAHPTLLTPLTSMIATYWVRPPALFLPPAVSRR